jgi:hypothetical protein
MTWSVAVGLLSLLLSAFLIRQIVYQLLCGTFRARGANVYRTREVHQIGIGRLSARRQCVC